MKTKGILLATLAFLCASVAFAQQAQVGYKFVWWDNGSPDNAFLIGGAGNSALTALKDTALGLTVTRWNTDDATAQFGIYTMDAGGNKLTESIYSDLSLGETVISQNFSEGDRIGFWVSSEGSVFDSTSGVPNDYAGGLAGSDSFEIRFDSHTSYPNYILQTVGMAPGENAPKGQPLPGVLATMLLGGVCLPIWRKFRAKRVA